MTMAGIGNAAAGSLIADGLTRLVTKHDNKPATKGDLKSLSLKLLGRYHLVTNLPRDASGRYPYFDIQNNKLEYLDMDSIDK